MLQYQEKCKTCGSKLIRRETQKKASQLKKAYYYTAYYSCTKCQKIYLNDKFKVINNFLFPEPPLTLTPVKQAGSLRPPPYQGEKSITPPLTRGSWVGFVPDVEIWTDGACVSNGQKHAKAAWAFVSGKTEKAGLVPGIKQTNNVAEGLAIFHALDWAAKSNFKKIKIYTDSQITIHNLRKPANKVKVNQEIFQKIENLIKQYNLLVDYEKVLGHSGDVNNTRADKLANKLAGKE